MDRWLDNNGDLNCIKNFVENDKKSSVSTPGVYDFKPRPTIASPISETSNFPTTSSPETSNSSTKGKDEKEVKNESRDQPEIDQLKMLQKFTRMQLLSTVQNVPKSEKPIETASSLNSVQSVEKVLPKLDKPKQSTYSTLSKTSTLSMQCHAQSSTTSKPLNQSKTLLQSRQPQSPAPALITQSSPLTQIDEPGLVFQIIFFGKIPAKCRTKFNLRRTFSSNFRLIIEPTKPHNSNTASAFVVKQKNLF